MADVSIQSRWLPPADYFTSCPSHQNQSLAHLMQMRTYRDLISNRLEIFMFIYKLFRLKTYFSVKPIFLRFITVTSYNWKAVFVLSVGPKLQVRLLQTTLDSKRGGDTSSLLLCDTFTYSQRDLEAYKRLGLSANLSV